MMKSVINAFVLSAILFGFLGAQVGAQEPVDDKTTPTGTWAWVHKNKSGRKMDLELTLAEKDGKVKCTLTAGKKKLVSKKGAFKDGVFTVTFSNKDDEPQYTFEGKPKGKTIRGEYTASDRGDEKLEWKAKKTVGLSDVVGNWSLYFETPDGNVVKPSFELSEDKDGKPFVEFESQDDQPAMAVTKTVFKKGVLTIMTDVEFQGNEMECEWELTLKGESAGGVLYFRFNESGAEGEIEVDGEKIK